MIYNCFNLEKVTMESYLTKYEKARVIGLRALHISRGAKTTITGMTDPYLMAKRELEQGICPIIIRRHYPDGEYRDVSVRKLSR
jgi:DNA-directed RNA polymerase subunit K/omega